MWHKCVSQLNKYLSKFLFLFISHNFRDTEKDRINRLFGCLTFFSDIAVAATSIR